MNADLGIFRRNLDNNDDVVCPVIYSLHLSAILTRPVLYEPTDPLSFKKPRAFTLAQNPRRIRLAPHAQRPRSTPLCILH